MISTCELFCAAILAASALAFANLHCSSLLCKSRNRWKSSSCSGDTFFRSLKYFKTPPTPPPLNLTLDALVEGTAGGDSGSTFHGKDRPGDNAHADGDLGGGTDTDILGRGLGLVLPHCNLAKLVFKPKLLVPCFLLIFSWPPFFCLSACTSSSL